MTELDKLKEFTICSVDKLRDEEVRMTVTTSFCLVQDLKVGNINSICVVKYSVLHTFMTSCLRKLVRVCLAVSSLTDYSHRYLHIKRS